MPVTVDPTTTPPDFAWHTSYIAPETDSVPDIINSTTDLVRDMLDEARDKSDDALDEATAAIELLKKAQLPDKLPDPPPVPTVQTNFNATIGFNPDTLPHLGQLTPETVLQFSPASIDIPDVLLELGPYVPIITGLTIPAAPVYVASAAPTSPGINLVLNVPTAPVANYGEVPALIELNMPVYTAPVLPVFTDPAPEFTDAAPDPFIQWKEPVYASDVRDQVKLVLGQMLTGGTGLPADIEQAIWDRARGRVDAAAAKQIEEAKAHWSTRGHELPTGMLNKQTIVILDGANLKSNEVSMEVAVEQAKLEQSNRQFAVQQGIGYEQVFVNLFLQVTDRNFQIAKFGVEVQIQVYNVKVVAFNARVTAFGAKIEKYKAELEVAFAYLRAFEAQVKAEVAKGEVNEQRLRAYTAKVQAYNAQVDAFKTLVQAEGVRVDLEKAKIDVYRGEIEAYVGQINGQRASFEAYSSRVQAEAAKAQLEEANARAYTAKVQGVAAKAEVALKRADTQIQNNKLQAEWSIANLQRVVAMTGQQLQVIQANAATYEAGTRRATAKFEADRSLRGVELQATIAANANVVARYQAALEAWRTQAQQILAIAGINAESLRAAGQIASTLAAGAMAGTHVSAGVSGSAGASQAKQDSTSRSRGFNQTLSDSSSYNVNHNFNN